ncbi:MAG: hypothetical protein UV74_C0013G0124 [Candidatus Woesebacteria bacterium GW2011_GWB1_43_14]|uniref:Uncharacterized protein n=1 Tax=Candidatus Woesebacteria bacterium GW2011_GWB1_43_14 TaxID=1618578 RepID=A0A0G1DHC9_9BACT|nr:MAG: hypothetical protein UV51_C0005G0100 [Candidatus Woesebacteria bacterium GW2011_GWC1_42_9]KKS97002.1 MAG: hypothetical protein UV74_C0013G0124 [Candidatus Woesebacteria bacterium GW2011_GWB1_43_14]
MSTVIPLILLVIIGALVFLFLYWKKLRDDYSRDTVFTTGLFVVIGSIAGGVGGNLLSKVLMENRVFVPQGTWFWGSVLVSFVFFLFGVRKKKLRFFETFEAYGMGIIVWFAIFASILYWPLSLVLIMFFILYLILNKYYKRFNWYQSGRVGFSGLTTLGLVFLLRSLVAVFFPTMLSFVGRVDSIVSASVAFLLFFALYNLSQT